MDFEEDEVQEFLEERLTALLSVWSDFDLTLAGLQKQDVQERLTYLVEETKLLKMVYRINEQLEQEQEQLLKTVDVLLKFPSLEKLFQIFNLWKKLYNNKRSH